MKKAVNIILCMLLYLGLITPHLQKEFRIFKVKPLNGYIVKIDKQIKKNNFSLR